jgi:hypothetical protein
MRNKARLAALIVAGMLVPVGTTLFGQDPPSPPPVGRQEQSKETTLTGCLTQVGGGTFVLKPKGQGAGGEVTVSGPGDLAKHNGHTVQLSGTMKREQGKEVFQVTQFKHVARSCD